MPGWLAFCGLSALPSCAHSCVLHALPLPPFLPSNALREAFSSDMATYTATCFEGVIESREHQKAHLNQLLGLLLRACPLTCLVIHSYTHHHRHPSLPPAERKSERGFRERCSALASSSATCKMVRVCRLAPAFALAPLACPPPPAIIRDERTTDFFPRKSDHGSRKDTRPNTASVRGTWDFRSSLQGFVPAWLGCCCPLLHFAACLDTATDASRLHHTGQRLVLSRLDTK